MTKKTNPFPPAVGLSSLLVIFGVLCLVVFALLALSTAQAEARMAEKARQNTMAQYEAQAQAQQILAKLRQGEIPQGVSCQDGIYRYSCKISDSQSLWVEAEISGEAWRILRWQVGTTLEWEAGDTIPVWNGEAEQEESYGRIDG